MMKNFKVWGGFLFINHKPIRAILAVKTKKRAIELLSQFNIGSREFKDYWSETGNALEVSIALSSPELILISSPDEKTFKIFEKEGPAGKK